MAAGTRPEDRVRQAVEDVGGTMKLTLAELLASFSDGSQGPADPAAVEAALAGAGIGHAPPLQGLDEDDLVAMWLKTSPDTDGHPGGDAPPDGGPTNGAGDGHVIGRDLTHSAQNGLLPKIIGRENEIDALVEVLCRRLPRNPLLVGPPGAGKGAVVEGLAQRIVDQDVPDDLRQLRVIELSAGALLTAAAGPADPASDIIGMGSDPLVVLFIEDFAFAIGAGGYDFGLSARLRPALASGTVRCVGSLTPSDYYRVVESDPALDRSFQPISVSELSPELTLEILKSAANGGEDGGDATTRNDVLEAVVTQAGRHLRNRSFPEKAFDVLDRTMARARRTEVPPTPELVADVVREVTGGGETVEAEAVTEKIRGLAPFLRKQVIGQDEAIDTLTSGLELKLRGLDLRPNRPNGVFLFTGPTGVGKTETARSLARYLFGSDDRMLRLDMSEYAEEYQVAKILGAPPAYVGYEHGAPLLDELRTRPFAVVLLDEVEKAHPSVHRLFLQVFEDGFLTTGAGTRVFFSDAVIVMTANLDLRRGAVGFGAQSTPSSSRLDRLDAHFPREFVNRIDAVCEFRPLDPKDVRRILTEVTLPNWLEANRDAGVELSLTDEAIEHLATSGYSKELGARELHRVVETELLPLVSDRIAAGFRGLLEVGVERGRLVASPGSEHQ